MGAGDDECPAAALGVVWIGQELDAVAVLGAAHREAAQAARYRASVGDLQVWWSTRI